MSQKLPHPFRLARLVAWSAASAILALGLCGCQTNLGDITGSLGDKAETSRPATDPRRDVELAHERFRANPKDADAALQYGKALRASGQKAQAVAVLEQATIALPKTMYGSMCMRRLVDESIAFDTRRASDYGRAL